MNQPLDPNSTEDFELTLETLDEWKTELDEFSNTVRRRLAMESLTTNGQMIGGDTSFHSSAEKSAQSPHQNDSENEVMDLLQSIRKLTP